MSSSRSGSPTRRNWDERNKLGLYNILVDVPENTPLPPELQQHVDEVLLATREGPRSPNARRIVETRPVAALQHEEDAKRLISQHLLFRGEESRDMADGIAMITSRPNLNLEREFLPTAPDASTPKLSRPQPDIAIGYLSRTEAMQHYPALEVGFARNLETVLNSFSLNPVVHAPFITSQWKPASGESYTIAHNQAARDGATITNYLNTLYEVAYGREATAVESSHISVTCDVQVVNIWIHWRTTDSEGDVTYWMKNLYDTTLRNEGMLRRAREILWNVVRYALGPRMESIKKALPLYKQNKPPTCRKGTQTTASVSSAGVTPPSWANFAPGPLTPSSAGDAGEAEPSKKRARTSKDDEDKTRQARSERTST